MGNIRIEQLRNKWKVIADGGIRKNFQYREDAEKYAKTLGYMEAAVHNKLTLEDLKNIKYVEEEQLPETEDASTQESSKEEGLSSEESGSEWVQQAEEDSETPEEEPHSSSQGW